MMIVYTVVVFLLCESVRHGRTFLCSLLQFRFYAVISLRPIMSLCAPDTLFRNWVSTPVSLPCIAQFKQSHLVILGSYQKHAHRKSDVFIGFLVYILVQWRTPANR